MDGVIVFAMAVLYVCLYWPHGVAAEDSALTPEKVVVNTALNPEMTHDEHAFMVIANELGFH